VSFYRDTVLPRLQDKAMDRQGTREVRARVCAGLTGRVLEIGFGTGLNVRYYPPEVTTVLAVEPSGVCMRMAAPRISSSSTVVEHAGLTGEHLDLPSEEVDVALSTWTLCTIPDLSAALEEVRRVLKPGGTFFFVEHGHAPDAKTARWQHRLDPLNQRLAGGCHLSRRIAESITQAGFEVEHLDQYYAEGEPKPWGYTYEGRAKKMA
jgi:ubiquinone/menaquinone biosynthesis C-methylase UbiE